MTFPTTPAATGDEPQPFWRRPLFGPLIVVMGAIILLFWTWGTWPDLLVDFGVQLYVPWRLAAGEVLYRDIAHYTGPLSVYYNATAFRLFGASLRVLVLCNLPILAGILAAIYYIGTKLGGRLCGFACGITFVTLFAFAHLTPTGNYNYVCPYEYEYTHAMLLCFGCLIFLGRMLDKGRVIDAIAAGLLGGLVFLTRAEFFVAIISAAGLGLLLLTFHSESLRKIIRFWIAFLFSVIVPPLFSVMGLSCAMPLRIAIHGTLGMWPALLAGNVAAQHFYHHSMGLDDPARSLRLLGIYCGVYLGIIFVLAGLTMIVPRKLALAGAVAAAGAGVAAIVLTWKQIEWISVFRPLPVFTLIAIVGSIFAIRRFGLDWRGRNIASMAAMFGVMSLVLLGKVILYARIVQYGCWLAMPATMLLVIIIFGWIPAWLKKQGRSPLIYLAGVAGVWGSLLIVHLFLTSFELRHLRITVGSGDDEFVATDRGVYVDRAVALIRQIVPPDKTVACFPEGIMINYLSRRRTATPYVNFNPPDLLLFGEENMLAALRRSPPDFVLIVHKDTSEFGERFFGTDYGRDLDTWINANYHEQPMGVDLGATPLRDNHFGIRLMIPNGPARN